jgi:hypothetical protein
VCRPPIRPAVAICSDWCAGTSERVVQVFEINAIMRICSSPVEPEYSRRSEMKGNEETSEVQNNGVVVLRELAGGCGRAFCSVRDAG